MQQQPELNQDLTSLEHKTTLQRRSDLLKPLNLGMITLLVVALGIMLTSPNPVWWYFIYIGAFLLLNLVIFLLHQYGFVRVAAQLFCHGFNLCIFFSLAINQLVVGEPSNAFLFGCIMALSLLMAGMLLGIEAIFLFAMLNTVLILTPFYLSMGSSRETLVAGFPILAFLYLIATVAWLYQRALNKAQVRLREAQQQLMRDELLRRETKIARDMQEQLLPQPLPPNQKLEVVSRSEPAREVSGDFYDFIYLNPNEVAFVVADVTGKSVSAAMLMTMARSIFRSEATKTASPAEVLRNVNQILCNDAAVTQYVSAFYAIFNTRYLTLHCSNAGHPFPMRLRGEEVDEFDLCGLPLGALLDARYEERLVRLKPGDRVLFYSDGVLEERDFERQPFGFERLAGILRRTKDITPQYTLEHIWKTVEAFRSYREQSDDMTVIVLQIGSEVVREDPPVEAPAPMVTAEV